MFNTITTGVSSTINTIFCANEVGLHVLFSDKIIWRENEMIYISPFFQHSIVFFLFVEVNQLLIVIVIEIS